MTRRRALSPAERTLRARLAAHTMHARNDPQAITANARAAFLAKFEREADPQGVLSPEERQRRAEHLRNAHFARLAFASAKARRDKRAGDRGGDGSADRQR